MHMQNLFSGKNLMFLVAAALSLTACKSSSKKVANPLSPDGIMMTKTWEIFTYQK